MPKLLDLLGFDRASVRTMDEDGRLHVAISNISKATVNPYFGYEIPGAESLGLNPNKTYMLLRDPAELEKAAPTFNNLPVLDTHVPVSAGDPHRERIIGSTGTDAKFVAPYLQNSLVFWDAEATSAIQRREMVELSSAYRYDLDLTPGTFQGMKYDGVMRNIRGNHVALVAEGRAGSDVVVGDSAKPSPQPRRPNGHPSNAVKPAVKAANDSGGHMAKKLSPRAVAVKGAMVAYLHPKLAADAQPKLGADLNALLKNVTEKRFPSQKAGLLGAMKQRFAGSMATDELDLGEVASLLDALNDAMGGGGEELEDFDDEFEEDEVPPEGGAEGMGGDGPKPAEALMQLLQEQNLPPEFLQQAAALCDQMQAPAKPAPSLKPKAPAPKEAPMPEDPKKAAPGIGKPAMDEAIATAKAEAKAETVKAMNEIRRAEKEVAPFIGEVVAQDSAAAVYKLALDAAKIDLTGVDPTAYGAMVRMLAKPSDPTPALANDAAANADVLKTLPALARIGRAV